MRFFRFDTWTVSSEFSNFQPPRVAKKVSVENTFDPSHAPFLHNGISKYSPDKAGAIQVKMDEDGLAPMIEKITHPQN